MLQMKRTPENSRQQASINLSDHYLFIKEAIMTNQEMRDVVKALNVELFKMNYKAGVRIRISKLSSPEMTMHSHMIQRQETDLKRCLSRKSKRARRNREFLS